MAESDTGALSRLLAAAFRDNPLNRAVIGDDPERRLRKNIHGMRAMLPTARVHGRVFVARRGDRAVGALVATPPLRHPLPPPSLRARLRCLIGQGRTVVRRWEEVFIALDRVHPRLPHWYLGTLGVDPAEQRTGVGSALLRALLEAADAEGLAIYLETDRDENARFYARHGFAVEDELTLLDVRVFRMWRPGTRAPDQPAL
jgi:GNAT superfamily N-acetyltransferase